MVSKADWQTVGVVNRVDGFNKKRGKQRTGQTEGAVNGVN